MMKVLTLAPYFLAVIPTLALVSWISRYHALLLVNNEAYGENQHRGRTINSRPLKSSWYIGSHNEGWKRVAEALPALEAVYLRQREQVSLYPIP